MDKTKIEWCDSTWNPVTGCKHGCEYCYARRIAERFGKKVPDFSGYPVSHSGVHMVDNKFDSNPYPFLFEPTFHAYRLDEPQRKTNLPATVEEAEREARNFLRRLQYERKKRGLPPLKYMLVTASTTDRITGEPVRIHHHILVNGGLGRDTVEDLWRRRKRRGQRQGDKIGYCNADRLQTAENGIAALCSYLARQAGGKKRWSSSHNLERPASRTVDMKYSHRQVEKWAQERPGREFWERRFPGWTLAGADYGISYEYNDFTGWAIYIKLRKKE